MNNNNQIIGKTWIFDYESGESYELQDLIDQNISPGWVLVEARKINDLGQIIGVANSVENGQRPILLNPIPEGWQEIVEEEPVQPEYGDLPVKQTGKSNLVFITHGAIPWWQNEQESISWIYHMSNSIAQYLTANGMHGWQVHAHPWIDGAKFKGLVPLKVLSRGYEEGTVAGRSIAADGWNHVHLISHSAGANLIQAIVDQVKPGPTTVHCTFLDPFVGHDETGVEAYGAGTEWSDQYFSRDRETGGGITKATEEPLDHAHNVDVTRLFKEKVAGYFISSGPNVNQPCVRTISSHAAAIAFYSNTVAGTVSVEYQGYGFPLSLEGGTWGGSPFLVVSNAPVELGTGDPTCYTLFQPVQGSFQSLVPVLNTPAYVTGSVLKYDHGFTAETQSPSWIAQVLSLTNRANYISFEARFESEIGAEGLLTVYWDTNVIGSVDERASVPGFRKYVFSFPMAETTGAHVLAFRLDPFTNVQSVITVTNITLGATGPSEPFRLQVTFDEEGGHRVLELTGQPGFNYVVEGSTNLLNWEPVAIVANTNGAVRFFDAGSTNHNQRFYRASVPLE